MKLYLLIFLIFSLFSCINQSNPANKVTSTSSTTPKVNARIANEELEDFHLKIERQTRTNDCTMGYMFVDGTAIAYTLELPWRENQQGISAIPDGSYTGHLRYDKNDKWRIQFDEVEGRTGIQIHIGNYTREISGCVLVGLTADVDNCAVFSSRIAYEKLKEKFYGSKTPNNTPNKKIKITIQ